MVRTIHCDFCDVLVIFTNETFTGKAKAKAAPTPAKVNDVEEYANSEEEANPVKKPRGKLSIACVVQGYS